jgi:hypothetical protein
MATETQEVVVTDVRIRFWSMVFLMVKFSIASIPAFLILMFVGAVAMGVMTSLTAPA